MTSILKIVQGSTEVSLFDASGLRLHVEGWKMDPADREVNTVREKILCKLVATDPDDAASQLQVLNRLLANAARFALGDPAQRVPVYIETQYEEETNKRYAIILGRHVRFKRSPFGPAAKTQSLFRSVELFITRRHPWGSHKPGLLPGRSQLLATDGPDFMKARGDRSVDLTSIFGHVPSDLRGGIIGDDGYAFGSEARKFTRNMLIQPSMEVGVDDWLNANFDAVTRITTDYKFGSACLHMDENNSGGAGNEYIYNAAFCEPIYPGAAYTASAYLKATFDDQAMYPRIILYWYTSADAFISTDFMNFPVPGDITEWTRVCVTGVAPDTAAKARVLISGIVGAGDVFDIWADGIQFERGRYATDFCDGTQDNCAWEGEPHNSMSIRMGTAQERRAVQLAQATINHLADSYFGHNILTTSWLVVNTNGWRDDTYALFGSHSLKIVAGAGTQQVRTIAPDDLAVPDGDFVTLSGWIRCDADPGASKVNIRIYDVTNATDRATAQATSACEDDWEFVTCTWENTTGLAANVRVYCRNVVNDSSTIAWFDCLQLELKNNPTPWCCGDLGSGHSWAGTRFDSDSSRTFSKLKYAIDMPAQWTIGVRVKTWVNCSDRSSAGYIFEWNSPDFANRLVMMLDHNANVPSVYFDFDTSTDTLVHDTDIVVDTWMWMILTFDGTTVSFYIDGSLTDTGAPTMDWSQRPSNLIVGSYNISSASLDGVLDDFFCLSRCMTAAEITDLSNSGKPMMGDPSLLFYFPFDGPQRTHIANFKERLGHEIDVIFNEDSDGGPAYSSNYAFSENWQMFDVAAIAQDDAVIFGSTHGPFHHVVLRMNGLGDLTTTTLVLEYWTGAAFTVLVLGTDYTILGAETLEEALEAEGEVVINLFPSDTGYDWDGTLTINGVTAWWLQIRESNAAPAYATYPRHGGQPVYAPRTNELRIPASSLHGDAPPTTMLRLLSPFGGDENEGPANLSRILMGVKSVGLEGFTSYLPLGGQDLPSGWVATYGADTSAVADGRSPGGYHAACDFAGGDAKEVRVTLTGTDRLRYFLGDYRIHVLAEQIGGAAGDISIMIRTFIKGVNVYDIHLDSETIECAGVDEGIEAVDLGSRNIIGDEDYSAETDLIFEIHAAREAGSAATVELHAFVPLPSDEAYCALDDTKSDTSSGSVALRGNEALDHDGGIVKKRTVKMAISETEFRPIVGWDSGGAFVELPHQDREARAYFLLLHYPTGGTWGTGPMIATLGCHVAAELQLHHRYRLLRGND